MSVTFAPAYSDDVKYRVSCSCGAVKSDVFPSYGDAFDYRMMNGTPVCGDDFCAGYPGSVECAEDAPELNLANTNAREVLYALGFDAQDDLCGSATAEGFLGRILIAEAMYQDAGVPAHNVGMVQYMGRPEGYVEDRLQELRVIAEYAKANHRDVQWA